VTFAPASYLSALRRIFRRERRHKLRRSPVKTCRKSDTPFQNNTSAALGTVASNIKRPTTVIVRDTDRKKRVFRTRRQTRRRTRRDRNTTVVTTTLPCVRRVRISGSRKIVLTFIAGNSSRTCVRIVFQTKTDGERILSSFRTNLYSFSFRTLNGTVRSLAT